MIGLMELNQNQQLLKLMETIKTSIIHVISKGSFLLCCFRSHLNERPSRRVARTLGCDQKTAPENLREGAEKFFTTAF